MGNINTRRIWVKAVAINYIGIVGANNQNIYRSSFSRGNGKKAEDPYKKWLPYIDSHKRAPSINKQTMAEFTLVFSNKTNTSNQLYHKDVVIISFSIFIKEE